MSQEEAMNNYIAQVEHLVSQLPTSPAVEGFRNEMYAQVKCHLAQPPIHCI